MDALWAQESGRGKNAKDSSAGAQGDFQIMPDVAREAHIDPHNWRQAASYAAMRVAHDRDQFGSLAAGIASYNAGAVRISGLQKRYGNEWQSHAPQETIDYINSISRAVDAANQRASTSSNSHTVNHTFGDTHMTVNTKASDPREVARAIKSAQDGHQRRLTWQANMGLT